MRTVIVGPRPPVFDARIARRAALGIDRFDEVWEDDERSQLSSGHADRNALVDRSLR